MIIDEAVAVGRVICETDPERAAQRDAQMRAELADPPTVEPPHPRLGEPSLTLPSGGAEGRLSLQGRVEVDGRIGLYDDLVGAGWQLIGWEADPAVGLTADDLAWFTSIGGTVRAVGPDGPVRDLDGAYARWFADHDCSLLLARPDFYVFGTGTPADGPGLLSALRSMLTPIRHHQPEDVLTP